MMTIPSIYQRHNFPMGYAYNPSWKNVSVGDRAWVTFYDRRYMADAQHMCTITFVSDNGILVRDDCEERDYPLLWRDIVGLDKIN